MEQAGLGDYTFAVLTENELKLPFYLVGAGCSWNQDLDPCTGTSRSHRSNRVRKRCSSAICEVVSIHRGQDHVLQIQRRDRGSDTLWLA